MSTVNVGDIVSSIKLIDEFTPVLARVEGALLKFDAEALATSATSNLLAFSGAKVATEANAMAMAIKAVGGTTVLSDQEMKKFNATMLEAAQKYELLGLQIPEQIAGHVANARAAQQAAIIETEAIEQVRIAQNEMYAEGKALAVQNAQIKAAVAREEAANHRLMVGQILSDEQQMNAAAKALSAEIATVKNIAAREEAANHQLMTKQILYDEQQMNAEAKALAAEKERVKNQLNKQELANHRLMTQQILYDEREINAQAKALNAEVTRIHTAETLAAFNARAIAHNTEVNNLTKTTNLYRTLGRDMTSVGQSLSMYVTLPFALAGASALKASANFQTATTQLQTLSAVTPEMAENMRKAVLSMSTEVAIGPQKLMEALLQVTSTGIRGAEALDILKIAAQGSSIGLGNTSEVAKTLTSAMQAYGMENMSASRAANILYKTVVEGKGDLQEFAGAMGRVVGIAATVGVSLADVGTYIATFTRLGVSAAEAVTSLRGTLQALELRDTRGANAALSQIGETIHSVRASIAERGLVQTLIDLKQRFGENDEALAKIFPNIRALAGVLSITGNQAQDAAGIFAHLSDSTDEFGTAFAKTAETTKFKWAALTAEFEKAWIRIGDSLVPALMRLIPALESIAAKLVSVANWFASLNKTTQDTIITIGGLVLAIGPLLIAFGGIYRVASLAIDVLLQFKGAIIPVAKTLADIPKLTEAAGTGIVGIGAQAKTAFASVSELTTRLMGMPLVFGGVTAAASGIAIALAFWVQEQETKRALDQLDKDIQDFRLKQTPEGRQKLKAESLIDPTARAEALKIVEINKRAQEMNKTLVAEKEALNGLPERWSDLGKAVASVPVREMGAISIEVAKSLANQKPLIEGEMATVVKAHNDAKKVVKELSEDAKLAYAEIAKSLIPLTKAQENQVLAWEKQNISVGLMARALDVNVDAVQRFLKQTKELKLAIEDVVTAEAKTNKSHAQFNEMLINSGKLMPGIERGYEKIIHRLMEVDGIVTNILPEGFMKAGTIIDEAGPTKSISRLMDKMEEFAQRHSKWTMRNSDMWKEWANKLRQYLVEDMKKTTEEADQLIQGFTEKALPWWKEHSNTIQKVADVIGIFGQAMEIAGHKTTAAVSRIATSTLSALASGGWWAAFKAGATSILTEFGSKIFKVEEKQVNDLRDAFFASQGGFEKLHQAMIDAGKESAFFAAWNAKTTKDWEAAVKDINAALEETKKKQEEIAQLNKDIADTQKEIDDLQKKLIPTWKDVSGIIDKYKLNVDALGTSINKLRLDDAAKGAVEDWDTMARAGADMDVVAKGMSGSINQIVQDYQKFGLAIPANMKPALENMARLGLLVDSNGKKITDLSTIKFGDPVKTEADIIKDAILALTDKLNTFIDKLAKLTGIADEVATDVNNSFKKAPWEDWPQPNWPSGGGRGGETGGDYFGGAQAAGGDYWVTKPTWFLAGEAGAERATFTPAGKGGSSDSAPFVIQLDSEVLYRGLVRKAKQKGWV